MSAPSSQAKSPEYYQKLAEEAVQCRGDFKSFPLKGDEPDLLAQVEALRAKASDFIALRYNPQLLGLETPEASEARHKELNLQDKCRWPVQETLYGIDGLAGRNAAGLQNEIKRIQGSLQDEAYEAWRKNNSLPESAIKAPEYYQQLAAKFPDLLKKGFRLSHKDPDLLTKLAAWKELATDVREMRLNPQRFGFPLPEDPLERARQEIAWDDKCEGVVDKMFDDLCKSLPKILGRVSAIEVREAVIETWLYIEESNLGSSERSAWCRERNLLIQEADAAAKEARYSGSLMQRAGRILGLGGASQGHQPQR